MFSGCEVIVMQGDNKKGRLILKRVEGSVLCKCKMCSKFNLVGKSKYHQYVHPPGNYRCPCPCCLKIFPIGILKKSLTKDKVGYDIRSKHPEITAKPIDEIHNKKKKLSKPPEIIPKSHLISISSGIAESRDGSGILKPRIRGCSFDIRCDKVERVITPLPDYQDGNVAIYVGGAVRKKHPALSNK